MLFLRTMSLCFVFVSARSFHPPCSAHCHVPFFGSAVAHLGDRFWLGQTLWRYGASTTHRLSFRLPNWPPDDSCLNTNGKSLNLSVCVLPLCRAALILSSTKEYSGCVPASTQCAAMSPNCVIVGDRWSLDPDSGGARGVFIWFATRWFVYSFVVVCSLGWIKPAA